jgi:glucose-1-phosphate thymidylyltransferase
VKIACPEEIALDRGWISADQVERLGREMAKTEYGRYLIEIAREKMVDDRRHRPAALAE